MYGLRLRVIFKDFANNDIYAQIFERDYTGDFVEREAAPPGIAFTWGDGAQEDLSIIWGSKAVLSFYTEEQGEFSDFYTADKRKFYLSVSFGQGRGFWRGWLVPEQRNEPIGWQPMLSLTFIDGLGELKNTPYLDTNGNAYTGQKSFITILTDILKKISINQLDEGGYDVILTNCNFDFEPGIRPFEYMHEDVSIYEGENCAYVLNNILQGHRLMQTHTEEPLQGNPLIEGSFWMVFQYNEAMHFDLDIPIPPVDNYMDMDLYDIDGVYYNSYSVKRLATVLYPNIFHTSEPMATNWPGWDRMEVNQNLGRRGNLIPNPDLLTDDGWVTDYPPIKLMPLADGTNALLLVGKGSTYLESAPTKAIYTEINNISGDGDTVLKLNFDYNIFFTYNYDLKQTAGAWVYWEILLIDEDEIFPTYWGTMHYNAEKSEKYIVFEPGYRYLSLNNDFAEGNGIVEGLVLPKPLIIKDAASVNDFDSFEIKIKGLPFNGKIQLIYYHYSRSQNQLYDATKVSLAYSKPSLQIIDSEGNLLATKNNFRIINNNRYLEEGDTLELSHGSLPDIAERLTLYSAGITDPNGNHIDAWDCDGAGNNGPYSYAEMVARLRFAQHGSPALMVDFTLASEVGIQPAHYLWRDYDVTNTKLFLMQNITWRMDELTASGSMVAILREYNDITIEVIPEETEKSNTSATGSKSSTSNNGSAPLIVSPNEMALDSGEVQFSLKSVEIIPNYNNEANEVGITGGQIIHHSINSLPQYEIDKLIDNSEPYDPTRTWTIDSGSIILPNNNAHFIYAKLPTAAGQTTATIFADENHVYAKRDEGYIIYKLGEVRAVSNGKRKTAVLWADSGHLPVTLDPASATELTLDGQKLNLNLDAYKQVKYNPSTMVVNTGTLTQGTVTDLAAVGGTDVIVQEVTGTDPLRVTFGFTDVARLNAFNMYFQYAGGAMHVLYVEAYNYTTLAWDVIGQIGTTADKTWYSFSIFLSERYLAAGNVSIRVSHQGTGINTHQAIFDYVDVSWGGGGGSYNDHAQLANRLWTASGHTGTNSKRPVFSAIGVAAEKDDISISFDDMPQAYPINPERGFALASITPNGAQKLNWSAMYGEDSTGHWARSFRMVDASHALLYQLPTNAPTDATPLLKGATGGGVAWSSVNAAIGNNALTATYLPLFNGTTLADSILRQNATGIGIGRYAMYRIDSVGNTAATSTISTTGIGSVFPRFLGQRANGTLTSPTAVTANGALVRISAVGYDGSAYSSEVGAIMISSDQNFTSTAQGTRISFYVVENETTTLLEAMRIRNTRNVFIGTYADGTTPGRLTVKGSTADGSTNIFVGRDSAETNVYSLDTDGNAIHSGYIQATTAKLTTGATVGYAWTCTNIDGSGAWAALPSFTYPAAGIAVSTGSAWGASISNTTIGTNLLTLTNPDAVTFPRFNADNTVTALTAANMKTALGVVDSQWTANPSVTGITYTAGIVSIGATPAASTNLLYVYSAGNTSQQAAWFQSNIASQAAVTIINGGATSDGLSVTATYRAIYATSANIGVYGVSTGGDGTCGVIGSSVNGTGVYGASTNNFGGLFGGLGVKIATGGLTIGTSEVIASTRIADFVSLKIGGTERIDSSGNVKSANGYNSNIVLSTTNTLLVSYGIITGIT